MKRVPMIILLLAMFVALGPPASATMQTLTDGNSVAKIDTQSQAGMFNWQVDGVNILYQQWFWYRIDSNAEQSIDTLPLISESHPIASVLDVKYGNDSDFTIMIRYLLTGGQSGSGTADVAETITINNGRNTSLDMHFFQYSDFDLNQIDNHRDVVTIDPTLQLVKQYPSPRSAGPVLSETIVSPKPSFAEAAYFPGTLNLLNNGVADNLGGAVAIAAPGDVTWAFQWDQTIAAHSSFIISKDKRLAPLAVPEPAAIALLGGVLLGLATKLRKRVV